MTGAFSHPDNQRISVARWMVAATEDADGQANWAAAALLAQVTWWSALNERTGRPRMSHQHAGVDGYWLVRTDDEWAEELGISGKTVARARKRLEERGLIETRRLREQGRTLMHWRRVPDPLPDTLSSQEAGPSLDKESTSQPDTLSTSQPDKVGTRSGATLFTQEKIKENVDREIAARDSARRFEEKFWPAYPARNGKKLDKAKALAIWMKLTYDEQRAAWTGARHYAASGQLPKDAFRWLRDRSWEDWQTPAQPGGNGNGSRQRSATADDYASVIREGLGW